jgi:hypothetical protein
MVARTAMVTETLIKYVLKIKLIMSLYIGILQLQRALGIWFVFENCLLGNTSVIDNIDLGHNKLNLTCMILLEKYCFFLSGEDLI